jgi:hypothetical protein
MDLVDRPFLNRFRRDQFNLEHPTTGAMIRERA